MKHVLPTLKQCEATNITNGELAKRLYSHITYDHALPPAYWYLGDEVGRLPRFELVMGYPDGCIAGILIPLTQDMADYLRSLANDYEKMDQLMTWDSFGLRPAADGSYYVETGDNND